MLLSESMSKWQEVRGAPHVYKWNKISYYLLKLYHDKVPGFSPRDIKILGWCPAGPVKLHGEKVSL